MNYVRLTKESASEIIHEGKHFGLLPALQSESEEGRAARVDGRHGCAAAVDTPSGRLMDTLTACH